MEANLQARVETITPDMAREYLKSNSMNRPLNDKTVNFYAQECGQETGSSMEKLFASARMAHC